LLNETGEMRGTVYENCFTSTWGVINFNQWQNLKLEKEIMFES
jgi:hypothetical protein